jgi:dTDP-4-amino-4,6-dideoxygalactose transaminase
VSELLRATRRISGFYIPHLQPYWDELDFACVENWLGGHRLEGARDAFMTKVRDCFPQAHEIVLTDSGKTALYAALKMLGAREGSEVIVPSYCCASVIASVVHAGCQPVLADSDEHLNISYESVVQALSPKTFAIVVPHMFGLKAAALEPILALGRSKGIVVIEDVAQAFGLRLEDGRLAGSLGDAAIFSAGLGKPLMGPGGGWAIMNVPVKQRIDLPEEPSGEARGRVRDFMRRFTGLRMRRGCGEIFHAVRSRLQSRFGAQPDLDVQRWAARECRGYRISDVEALLTSRQMVRIDENIACRMSRVYRWKALLADAGIDCTTLPNAMNTFTALPLFFKGEDGARFRGELEARGITTQPCTTPLHLRPHGRLFRRTDMARVEGMWQGLFTVPVRPNLSEKDWGVITRAVRRIGKALAR